MKNRHSATLLAMFDEKVYLRSGTADDIERASFASCIRYAKSVGAGYDLLSLSFPMQEGSTLARACTPYQKMLEDFVGGERFYQLATENQVGEIRDAYIFNGNFQIAHEGEDSIRRLINAVNFDPVLAPQLARITEASYRTGQYLSTKKETNGFQWLHFHGLKPPASEEELEKLMVFLSFNWPASDGFGDYWDYITGHDFDSAVLDQEERENIQSVTQQLCGDRSLLQTLYENLRPTLSDKLVASNANEMLIRVVKQPFAQTLARKYIAALNWYGAAETESLEAYDLAQFLLTAILVELDARDSKDEERNSVGTFYLYNPAKFADQPLRVIRTGVEKYLIAECGVSPETVAIASHLLLAKITPALVVRDVPENITLGSLAWVSFSVAVALVEANYKGISRLMTYDEIMMFSQIDPVSEGLSQLQSMVCMGVIIDWGLINGVITQANLSISVEEAFSVASEAYRSFVEQLATTTAIWATAPPTRLEAARQALNEAAPGCDFLEDRILRHNTDKFSTSYKMSMLDLHIEGELSSQEWDWREEGRLYDKYPDLPWMRPNQEVFEERVHAHHAQLHKALVSNIHLAFATMPKADADIFERNDISFFTLRPSVASQPFSNGTGLGNTRLYDTYRKRDAATGRYGIVMYVVSRNNKYLCYEMFTLRGECRKNQHLGEFIFRTRRNELLSRQDYKGDIDKWFHVAEELYAPVDLDCYRKGNPPRAEYDNKAVMDKLGTLSASSVKPSLKYSAYQYFLSPHVSRIVTFIVAHRPLATPQELIGALTVYTEREIKREIYDLVEDLLVALLVPFKECIEDFASGDSDRYIDGAIGCVADGLAVVATVLGQLPMTVGLRASMNTVKIVSKIKKSLNILADSFQVIQSLPKLLVITSKVLNKNTQTPLLEVVHPFEVAGYDLSIMTGRSECQDLLSSRTLASIFNAKWRPHSGSVDTINVLAIFSEDHWYGVNRFGKPWGKRIDIVPAEAYALPGSRDILPTSDILYVLERTISVAMDKVGYAITALIFPTFESKADSAIGIFLHRSQEVKDALKKLLWVLKADFSAMSVRNIALDPVKASSSLIELDVLKYQQWKDADVSEKEQLQFLTVNVQNLNNRLTGAYFNYGEIADDLIHELLLIEPAHMDIAIAQSVMGEKGLDVAPLLDLVAGRRPMPQGGEYHSSSQAMLNADSMAMTVSLLNQSMVDYPKFADNIAILTEAVDGNVRSSQVWIDFNTRSVA